MGMPKFPVAMNPCREPGKDTPNSPLTNPRFCRWRKGEAWNQERDIVSSDASPLPLYFEAQYCPRWQRHDDHAGKWFGSCVHSCNSCERCKLRKSKCDREHPSCQRCKDAGASCRYQGRKRPGFPAGHRDLLEDKIRESK